MSHGVHAVQHEAEHQIEHEEHGHGGGHGKGENNVCTREVHSMITMPLPDDSSAGVPNLVAP